MVSLIRSVSVKSNGSLGFTSPPGQLPDPVLAVDGWYVFEGDGQTPCRVRHDATMRQTGQNLNVTNEMFPLRPFDGVKVDWRSKITMKLIQRPDWLEWIKSLQGDWVWPRFSKKTFGWMDYDDNIELRMNALDCGGNLRNMSKKVDGSWGYVKTLSFGGSPPTDITYKTHPHLFIKQVLVGRSQMYNPYWVVDKGEVGGIGDLYIPAVTNTWAAHPLSQLEFFPPLPFDTSINCVPVSIEAYCFSGSNTYGLISGSWYTLEEMLVVGTESDRTRGGSWLDRRVYVDDWIETCPPPVIGWTRQK